ncbi:TMEM14 family protein [Brevibacillus laterosporus]|uniref:TMEM14 family protein n=1 Tax=Brevibacillus halotolerans TaxID=1507437 RepID=A0ABT4HW11_9BACL|nr:MULTISPECIES: TMEM14 family protein [Brevibacillus]MCR8985250.1 TMEM14 family protein [Brevibacillus laterosporus]MCZ0830979.1 TMEM14 family protein [Brevibacillus halotolerans]
MKRGFLYPVFGVIMLLAVVGFTTQFLQNPGTMIALITFSALLLYLARNFLKTGKFMPRFTKKTPKVRPMKPGLKRSVTANRRPNPFQVIEGSKGSKKDKRDKTKQNKPKMYQ